MLYSVAWISRGARTGSGEGEADFVILAPGVGIVVIEVKGGRVHCEDGEWFSTSRDGAQHWVKDPFQQASRSKHELLAIVKSTSRFRNRWLPAHHAVCFPHVRRADLRELPEAPMKMQFAEDDLDTLYDAIGRLCDGMDELEGSTFSLNDCKAIAAMLKPSIELAGRWAVMAKRQLGIMERLTDEQRLVVRSASENRRLAVTGPAGTGKTLVSLCVARKALDSSLPVLVIVPTTLLKEYAEAVLEGGKGQLVVRTPQLQRSSLIEVFDRGASLIFVDEAQDIPLETWDYIEHLLERSPSGFLIVAYDSNQRMKRNAEFYLPDGLMTMRLSRVIRNTRQIGEFTTRFFRGDGEVSAAGPEGLAVEFIDSESEQSPGGALGRYIKKLLKGEGFEPHDIVVLFVDRGPRGGAKGIPPGDGIRFQGVGQHWRRFGQQVVIPTGGVWGFRGMESSVVILVNLDSAVDKDLLEACYVGASRARHILAIFAGEATRHRINRLTEAGSVSE